VSDILFNISVSDWSEIIRNYALGGSALLTSVSAYLGLKNWKFQQEWKEKRDIAIKSLHGIDNLERAFSEAVINPFSYDDLKLLIPSVSKFEGRAASISIVFEKNLTSKLNNLDKALEEFEKNLVPANILLNYNFKKQVRAIVASTNLFSAYLNQVKLVANVSILSEEDSKLYLQNYREKTFSKVQVTEASKHQILTDLRDLEDRILVEGGLK